MSIKSTLKEKVIAFLIHLSISATVVGIVFAVIFYLWYPKPYYEASAAWEVIRILIAVDVVLGPLLTLILFKRGKPSLVMDLSIIAAIQIAALVYGTSVIYSERPYYVVLSADRFEMVRQKDIDKSKLQFDELKNKAINRPIFAVATFPEDEKEAADMLQKILWEGEPDIHQRAELLKKYGESKDIILKVAKEINMLNKSTDKDKPELKAFFKKHAEEKEKFVFVPLVGKNKDLAMILDKETALPIDTLSINPWVE